MSDADLLLPDDDSFVQTAIQGLRAPTHLPDFWDQLAFHLDEAHDELAADGHMVLALVPDLAVPEPSPHHVEDPWPEPAPEPELHWHPDPVPAPEPVDLFGPVDEPVYDEPDHDEPTELVPSLPRHRREPLRAGVPQAFVEAPTAVAPAPRRMAAPRVQHDRAVVPTSLRRASNAVLLLLAIVAVVVAIVAGLTLVRQRSEAGPSTPPQQALEASGTILAPRASLH